MRKNYQSRCKGLVAIMLTRSLSLFFFLFNKITLFSLKKKKKIGRCRGLFFQSTTDQIQHLSDPPEAQSPTTLVIHGRPNMRKNSPKAIHRAQSPKEKRKAQPTWLSTFSLPHEGVLKYFENERENGLQTSFSLLPWRGARGAEGRHS